MSNITKDQVIEWLSAQSVLEVAAGHLEPPAVNSWRLQVDAGERDGTRAGLVKVF